ncbi:SIR2 family protein [Litorilinea aerophila]|uniref:Novel STAND NTPase 1 domain-containing protein n=1 Tax=Litorilinea aerophila TaxID=1204385 RepID=A0A540VGI2_9CHLR|nr:SIR2 family protein [Litorilinea aerophila]MCC9076549.1 SIR2 family protein [Litorilinea aerophila]
MLVIPEALLEQIERGNVLLFVGERFARNQDGRALVDRLEDHLVARCQLSPDEDYTFPEAAQAYQDQFGRQALIQFLREQVELTGAQPQKAHDLIARLGSLKVIATTCVDRRLERAFEAAGRSLDVIVSSADVALEEGEKTQLYKLRGTLEQVQSLVLTEDDYEDFFLDQDSVSVVLEGYLARKTIVFVGYDLADPEFKRLFSKVTGALDLFARRAYAFGGEPSPRVLRWCKRHGVEVIDVRATAFLETLMAQLASRSRPSSTPAPLAGDPTPMPLPTRPYKHLSAYEAEDAPIFFGREQETAALLSLIHAHRLVLFYGPSGAGKTSLLQAGVLPRLAQADPPYVAVMVRALEEPETAIRQALARLRPDADLPPGSLVDCLAAATRDLPGTLVLVLDQFEEFFLRFSATARARFIAQMGRLFDARDVPVKVVFSLREEWLAAMGEFDDRLPEIFRTKMRLLPLTRSQARQAIQEPARRLGIRYAADLVEDLLDELVAGSTEGPAGSEDSTVMPPQLQLVCDGLYARAAADGREEITPADFAALGGAQGILARYVDTSLAEFSAPEREIARHLLLALVTSQGTRTAVRRELLTHGVSEWAGSQAVERILDRLVRQRLVRGVGDGDRYELTHDVLAATVASWVDEQDRQLKRARELLQQELADWQQDPELLLGESKFQRLDQVRDRLDLHGPAAALLARAAIRYDQEPDYWLARVGDEGAQETLLLSLLEHEAPEARVAAARLLAGVAGPSTAGALVTRILEDGCQPVRDQAARSLARLEAPDAVDRLAAALDEALPETQARVRRGLAQILHLDPSLLMGLDRRRRRGVAWTLAHMRLAANLPWLRQVVAVGAGAGGLAFGLGLTPPLVLHAAGTLYTPGAAGPVASVLDALFIGPMVALMGLVAGALLAAGIGVGRLLWPEPGRLLPRLVLGGLAGGVGTGLVLAPLVTVDADGPVAALLSSLGAGLFGVLLAWGVVAGLAVARWPVLAWAAAALGGGVGLVLMGLSGFAPFGTGPAAAVPPWLIPTSGALTGLLLAAGLQWALARRSPQAGV